MRNPFTIGIVEDSENFCNRQTELEDLLTYARSGNNVVLYSPRRYGKSSTVSRLSKILEKEEILTVYVDLFPITSEQDIITRFSTAIFRGIGRGADPRSILERMRDVFRQIVPSVEANQDGFNLSVKFDASTKSDLLLDDLMEGVYRYVKKKKVRALITFDEFQEITELRASKRIEGILRSHIQRHREIAYFFVGSRRRILKDIFSNESRPFYKSAFFYKLKEISCEEFVSFIVKKFKKSGKSCPQQAAEKMYGLVRGYPYYVQKLASIAWELTDKQCSQGMVEEAYQSLIKIESVDFEGIFSGLTIIQKALLKAVAIEPTPKPYSRDFLGKHRLSVGGAQNAMKVLLTKDLIEIDEQKIHRLTDPVLGAWLVRV